MPEIIRVGDMEGWDNEKEEFVNIKGGNIVIEHSLKSIEKWEAITEKSFLDNPSLDQDEFILYIKCMTLNKPDEHLYKILSVDNIKQIQDYMKRPMTATKLVSHGPSRRSGEQSTAEMIYYQMIALNIPLEFAKWHINRLLVLIQLVSRMNEAAYDPKKKNRRMTGHDISARNKLNAERLKQFNTHG